MSLMQYLIPLHNYNYVYNCLCSLLWYVTVHNCNNYVIVIPFHIQTAVELNVLAFSSPSGPVHQAASQVNLTCQPIDFYVPPVRSVEWTSTCSGSCFVPGMSGSVITREALRASDAGVHTCTLIDALGNRGTGEVVVNVSGTCVSWCTCI